MGSCSSVTKPNSIRLVNLSSTGSAELWSLLDDESNHSADSPRAPSPESMLMELEIELGEGNHIQLPDTPPPKEWLQAFMRAVHVLKREKGETKALPYVSYFIAEKQRKRIKDDPDLVDAFSIQTTAFTQQGRHEDALVACMNAYRTARRIYGPVHVKSLILYFGAATIYRRLGNKRTFFQIFKYLLEVQQLGNPNRQLPVGMNAVLFWEIAVRYMKHQRIHKLEQLMNSPFKKVARSASEEDAHRVLFLETMRLYREKRRYDKVGCRLKRIRAWYTENHKEMPQYMHKWLPELEARCDHFEEWRTDASMNFDQRLSPLDSDMSL